MKIKQKKILIFRLILKIASLQKLKQIRVFITIAFKFIQPFYFTLNRQTKMIEFGDKDISVYLCSFEIQIQSANILIKFPCHYFIEWKSINGKVLACSKKYPSSNNSLIQFNQKMAIATEMLYDNNQKKFYKKDTLLMINLVSKSRPDQIKLVGRVNIDLSQIANNSVCIYSELASYKLTYCSVNADVAFFVKMVVKQLTNKHPYNLDKSSFNDFFAINAAVNPTENNKGFEKFTTNIQNVTFPHFKSKQEKNQDFKKNQKSQKKFIQDTHTVTNYIKNEESSFRTVPPKRQMTFKSTNDSMDHNNLWNFKQQKFSEQIDVNKRKINDLQKKISDLCNSLEDTKNQVQRKDNQNRQNEQIIEKLREKQYRIKQQYESLKKMKNSSSSNDYINCDQEQIIQICQPQRDKFPSHKCHIPLSPYNQKLSLKLEAQRQLQQNQYYIRQLQSSKNQLQKKLINQKNQFQQFQILWKQKREHYEQKLKSFQKQKKQLVYEVQSLKKSKFKVEESNDQKNRIRQQYKQLEHEMMKVRFELNQKVQKFADLSQRIQSKQLELQRIRIQAKQVSLQKASQQRQITQLAIANQKVKDQLRIKDQQIQKLDYKVRQSQNKVSTLSNDLVQNKKIEQENRKIEQKLTTYNSYMETLQNTIKNLQNQIQACQYISRINQNLKADITKLELTIKDKQKIIEQKCKRIIEKESQIVKIQQKSQKTTQQKQQLLQKNQSFLEQIQKIEQILQESFHKKDKQNQEIISKLKQEIRLGNEEYEHIMKQKSELQDEIQHLVEQKDQQIGQLQKQISNLQYRVQDLLKTISDKLNIITMKQIELQNRKLINDQLTRKLQKMQDKQNQMQQTIKILEQQSKKIFDIIEQKQFIDAQLVELRKNTEVQYELIQQLQENAMQIKMQKQELNRKYFEEVQNSQQLRQLVKDKQNLVQNLNEQTNSLRAKIQQLEMIGDEMNQKMQNLIDQIKGKHQLISNLQQKYESQLKVQFQLQSLLRIRSNDNMAQMSDLNNDRNNNQLKNSEYLLLKRQNQLKQQILLNQRNVQKFKTQFNEVKTQNHYLNKKIQQLEALGIKGTKIQQEQIAYQKNQEITPVKNYLNDQLQLKSGQNYLLSDRKAPTSNRSNESVGSLQYIQNPLFIAQKSKSDKNEQIPELRFKYYDEEKVHDLNLQTNSLSDDHRFGQFQLKQNNKSVGIRSKKLQISNRLNFQKIGVKFTNQENQDPELKIQKLFSVIELKNIIIKDIQSREYQLKLKINQINQKFSKTQKQGSSYKGQIRSNTPKKGQNAQKQQNTLNSPSKRSRSPSPTSKLIKNQSQQQKQMLKVKIEQKNQQTKKLKKNIRLMNLELVTLRNLKRQKIIGGLGIRINKAQSQTYSNGGFNDLSETNYFNLTNAVNPNEKSYIIKRNLNQQESLYDSRRSPKKLSKYGEIISNRQNLQKKFNVHSRVSIPKKMFGQSNRQNKEVMKTEQRILDKLQNTAHFSLIQQQNNTQFVTNTQQLKIKITELQQALLICEQEKMFLENQIQLFEEEKFCLSSDLNSRQIEIYELYKSIIAMKQEISMLKYQNQAYLKMIQDHEANVNSLVQKAEQHCSKMNQKPKQNQRISSISVSNISCHNQELKSEISCDYLMKQTVARQQQRFSMLQKIEKYQKKVQQSLFLQKQRQILQQQIQSKEQILIDQNQKLYEQQSEIKGLNQKITFLEKEMKNLSQVLQRKESFANQNQNITLIIHENESLQRQNQNLKQQINYLGNQIDRINQQFGSLNNLLFKRQQQISHQKRVIQEISYDRKKRQQQYICNINYYQGKIVQMQQKLAIIEGNPRPSQSSSTISQIGYRIQDLQEEFQNLKENIKICLIQKKQPNNNQIHQFISALLESMQNNIKCSLNFILQSKQRPVQTLC